MTEPVTLPTGTVTFLFSDIEGSTKLLNRLGEQYPHVLETHQRLLREAFSRHQGHEVATEGDSFFVVFASAPEAVAAAVEAQRALAEHPWGEDGPVRVRMGLHTGEAVLGGDSYAGIDVHRAARIAAAAHGGQVLVSATTRALAENVFPEGVTLRDLGDHRLKDLVRPEHLCQLVVEGLEADFPPVRTLERRVSNLPEQLTTFIGRRREVEELTAALGRTRLLTLTGPGGTGKSRLSIQVATEVVEGFEDGAVFVPLAPLRDPALVLPTVARALGLAEDPARPSLEVLAEHLGDKRVLLVLDNVEQVIEAASEVGQLLSLTPGVKVIATSREALGLQGEQEYQVPPLRLPDIRRLPPVEQLSQYEAVALFIERATSVKPGFRVTNENAPAVAEITSRLDGLPLAIELAAARVKVLSPQAILDRLEHRLTLLVSGARDLPGRQRTLRGAIDWSFELLDEPEQRLFARAAVFRGGLTLEGAEAVCSPDGELGVDVFEAVASLVNKSLLRQADTEEPRFFMLDTIREYAGERLSASGALGEMARRHERFFLDLAERARPELVGDRRAHWLDVLEMEHDNFRAVLDHAGQEVAVEAALRLVAVLWRFWQFRGHLREARGRIEAVLALPGTADHPVALAAAHEAAGGVTYWMADFPATIRHYEESLALFRRVGDRAGEAEALYNLAFPYTVSSGASEEDLARARELFEQSRALFRDLGDQAGLAKVTWGLGNLQNRMVDLDGALDTLRESVEAYRRIGDRFGLGWALHTTGIVMLRVGEVDGAVELFREAMHLFSEAGDLSAITLLLADFGAVAYRRDERERAARLAGASAAVQEASGTDLGEVTTEDPAWTGALAEIRADDRLAALRSEGEKLSVEDAVAYALEGT